MEMCDIMMLGCGIDDDLLEDVLDTIAFIEGEESENGQNTEE